MDPCGNFQAGLGLQQSGSSSPIVSRFFASFVSPVRIMPGQDHKTKQHNRALSEPFSAPSLLFVLPKPCGASGRPNSPGRLRRAEGGEAKAHCQGSNNPHGFLVSQPFWCYRGVAALNWQIPFLQSFLCRSPWDHFGLGQMGGHKLSCRYGSGTEWDVSASFNVSWRSRRC